MWTESWLESVKQDIQYAVRSLRRQPGFAATALLTLGVTTGLASGVATGFSALFRQPWDVPRSEEVAQLLPGRNRTEMSYAAYRELAAHAQMATLVATNCGIRPRFEDCKVKIDHEPETALFVSGNYFSVLGIGMHLGRSFGASDDELSHPLTVVIISHALWQRRFGSDRGIVGRTIDIDAVPFTIIGVASRSFAGTSMVRTNAWLPIAAGELLRPAPRAARFVHVAARVGPRVFRAQAEAELQSLDRASAPHDPRRSQVRLVNTTLFPDPNPQIEADVYLFFGVLMLGVLLVLLLSCVNISTLLLARTLARSREIAVRASLGAGRARIVRQLLTESLILAAGSSAIGLWIASIVPRHFLNRVLDASGFGGTAVPLRPDTAVLAFSVALCLLTCATFGVAPALHASRRDVSGALRGESPPVIRRFSLRATLLATQIALSLTLLVNVGLLVRSVPHFGNDHLGYSANGISVASLEPPASYGPERLRDVARVLRVRLQAFGPEERFAIVTNAPFRDAAKRFVRLPGHSPDISRAHNVVGVSANYFRLLNIPLLTGRGFSPADGADAIVINEALARKYFGTSDAVGQTMLVGSSQENGTAKLIVGIVRDAVTDRSGLGARSSVQPGLYELVSADSQFDSDLGYRLPELLVRGTPEEFQHRLEGLVSNIDSRVTVRIAPLSVGIARQTSEVGFMAALGGTLGAVALILASIGVFGLFAYIVRDQTRNIGIRIALGARPVQVLRDTLGFGIRPIVVGAVLGLAGAFSAAQILRGEVYGVSPLDPLAYLSAMGVLAATATAAISIPAWRATRVDPVVALRHD